MPYLRHLRCPFVLVNLRSGCPVKCYQLSRLAGLYPKIDIVESRERPTAACCRYMFSRGAVHIPHKEYRSKILLLTLMLPRHEVQCGQT